MMNAIKKHSPSSSRMANTTSLPLFVATIIFILFSPSTAFTSSLLNSSSSRHQNNDQNSPYQKVVTTTSLHSSSDNTLTSTNNKNDNALNEMQTLGNQVILSAAKYHGATEEMVSIDWKSDRIIVTVDVGLDEGSGEVVFGDLLEDDFDDDDLEFDEEFDDEDFNDEDFDNDEEEDFEALQEQLGLQPESTSSNRIDLTLIARTINEYLSEDGENSPKFRIAQLHEIEVTTPEFDNVLRADSSNGVDMFEVYKGFDVIVDYWEVPKKKKKKKGGKAGKEVETVAQAVQEEEEEPKRTQKVIEGKLVGRDEEKDVTMINVKGRIMKIKNDMIESVMLPKAKREKGVK